MDWVEGEEAAKWSLEDGESRGAQMLTCVSHLLPNQIQARFRMCMSNKFPGDAGLEKMLGEPRVRGRQNGSCPGGCCPDVKGSGGREQDH